MELPVYNAQGAKSGTVAASDAVFNVPMNRDLVYQIATSQMSNRRQTLAHGRTRAEVRGGGAKPWRQKGTGRARHGSIRSPIWKGGGVTHGPLKDVNFKKSINRSMARKALGAVLSARAAEGKLLVVDGFDPIADGKTKSARGFMAALTANFPEYATGKDKAGRVLVVLAGGKEDEMTRRALGNLPFVQTARVSDLNALDVLSFPYVIMAKEAVGQREKRIANSEK
ncbi:MAG TPA: 50S ribosomal protein L4 [Candidatus Paceibacterota bacterium]|nr:50S ribosomal protein L4 [Candidatus Paceibacterota bacterium]